MGEVSLASEGPEFRASLLRSDYGGMVEVQRLGIESGLWNVEAQYYHFDAPSGYDLQDVLDPVEL
jgi:hypothetical protein